MTKRLVHLSSCGHGVYTDERGRLLVNADPNATGKACIISDTGNYVMMDENGRLIVSDTERREDMNFLSFLSGIFAPAAKLIDDIHVSEEEKMQLRNELEKIQSEVVNNAIELQKNEAQMRAQVMVAETQSDSWLTRSWRPMVMLGLFGIVLADYFGLSHKGVPEELFEIFKYGVIGIGGGRSAEKISQIIKGAGK